MNRIVFAGLFSFALVISQMAQATQTAPINPTVKTTPVASTPALQQGAPLTPNPAIPLTQAPAFSDVQIKQIEKIIHDYLVKNPQVLVEASQAYQDQEMAKAKTKTQEAVSKNSTSLFNSPSSPTVGNKNGDVTVVEFLDYQCAHCKEMSSVLATLVQSDNKLRVVVKELPIFGGSSKFAAQASIAAGKQGPVKFLAFHKALLETELPLTNEKILDVAKKAGIDTAQLQSDMKTKIVDDQINDNFKLAQALGLLGTPAFIVANRNGSHIEYVPGSVTLDSLKQTISQVRK